jgi:hypothetical protein
MPQVEKRKNPEPNLQAVIYDLCHDMSMHSTRTDDTFSKYLQLPFPRKFFLQEKAAETTKQKEEKRGGNLSPKNMKACPSISTTLLQSCAEIGTQSTVKRRIKTLHLSFTRYCHKARDHPSIRP